MVPKVIGDNTQTKAGQKPGKDWVTGGQYRTTLRIVLSMSDQRTLPGGMRSARNRTIWRVTFFAVIGFFLLAPIVANTGFGIGFSPVLSQSMQPTFSAGDLEITKLVPAASVVVGDVVVLNDPEAQAKYSHRVTSVVDAAGSITLSTRGDANPAVDRHPVIIDTATQISKVVTTVPFLGYSVLFLASPNAGWLGFALFLVGATLFVARLLIRTYGKHQPKEELT